MIDCMANRYGPEAHLDDIQGSRNDGVESVGKLLIAIALAVDLLGAPPPLTAMHDVHTIYRNKSNVDVHRCHPCHAQVFENLLRLFYGICGWQTHRCVIRLSRNASSSSRSMCFSDDVVPITVTVRRPYDCKYSPCSRETRVSAAAKSQTTQNKNS